MNRSILDFFQKVPSKTTPSSSPAVKELNGVETPKNQGKSNPSTPKVKQVVNNTPVKSKSKSPNQNSDYENSPPVKVKKSKKILFDSDSDCEVPVKTKARAVSAISSRTSTPLHERVESSEEENSEPPKSSAKQKMQDKLSKFQESSPTVKKNDEVVKKVAPSSNVELSDNDDAELSENKKWDHLTYEFLNDKKRRDKKMRRPDHPDYDPRTIHVPDQFKEKCTPAMRQWWAIKENNFDTILFFKVGKFYELYHMDAVVGVNELNLIYMRGSFAHSGFPEISYTRMADQLVFKGYKVARVEQTETVETMQDRTKGRPVKEKVVRRDICEIATPGVHLPSIRQEEIRGNAASDSNDQALAENYALSTARSQQRFLFVMKEDRPVDNGHEADQSHLLQLDATFNNEDHEVSMVTSGSEDRLLWERVYSVAFVCVADGTIHVGSFPDDRHSSRLRTLFTRHVPAQILYNKKNLSPYTMSLLNQSLASTAKETITFWSADKTLSTLAESKYFLNDAGHLEWPDAIKAFLSKSDTLGLSADPRFTHAVECIGGLVQYLRYCLVDDVVLSLKAFATYEPPDKMDIYRAFTADNANHAAKEIAPFYEKQQRLVMDSITLHNLDILLNSNTGLIHGTLLERIDCCRTSFGKRKLREVVASPPCHPHKIQERQDAIQSLMELPPAKLEAVKSLLKRLPDLERLLVKIHQIGARNPDSQHPDCNAVLYELINYSKKQITDFITALNGFECAGDVAAQMRALNIQNGLIRRLVCYSEAGGTFPNMKETLSYFKNAFDHEKARKEGKIIPEPGVDEDYDASVLKIKEIARLADEYLTSESRSLGFKVTYFGTARKRYQLEVPDNKKVPNHYTLASQRKGYRRYRTPQVDNFLADLIAAEEMQSAALKDIMRRLFYRFSSNFAAWRTIVSNIASLDCLIALTDYSKSLPEPSCRPEILSLPLSDNYQGHSVLHIVDGRHPFVSETYFGCEFIPNDMSLGNEEPCVVLITGPNMGGKSTLMRQTALLVVLAHIGCRVPASQCQLTPVDRIFTRLGAADRILSGESTFLVEMAETGCILQHASRHSLVLLDELGRGTSTYDGTALASSVLHYLTHASHLLAGCRVLFSSHYHVLLDMVTADVQANLVKLGHMACLVESEEDNSDKMEERITFLYKFMPGGCPKSYGFNAARLAHLPEKVIIEGRQKAMELEEETLLLTLLRDLALNKSDQLSAIQSQLKALK